VSPADQQRASIQKSPGSRLMDIPARIGQRAVMLRILMLLTLAGLTACSGDPRSLGITGPGVNPPPAQQNASPFAEDTGAAPGLPTSGSFYGPTNNGPVTPSSGFWGYNN
jgi:hypothetical protein